MPLKKGKLWNVAEFWLALVVNTVNQWQKEEYNPQTLALWSTPILQMNVFECGRERDVVIKDFCGQKNKAIFYVYTVCIKFHNLI